MLQIDKKEKWVPVEIPIMTGKRGGKSRNNPKNSEASKNWRDDAKGSLSVFIDKSSDLTHAF